MYSTADHHPAVSHKIKVCGVREVTNIKAVDGLGVDYIGFIFYEKSPRYANATAPLAFNVPTTAKRVGVFVNAKPTVIKGIALLWGLDFIQMHGDESPDDVKVVSSITDLPVWKAFRLHENFDFASVQEYSPYAKAFVFDAAGYWYGGNGKHYDWKLLHQYKGPTPFWLSGGIGPADAEVLKNFKHPFCLGYDVNSKFEVVPGRKNPDKLGDFVRAVKAFK